MKSDTPSDGIIPGTYPVADTEFLYLRDFTAESFERKFRAIGNHVRRSDVKPSRGGMVSENIQIVLPDGRSFFGLSYRGDIAGWERSILEYTSHNALELARVNGRIFELFSGEHFELASCTARFYEI